MQLCPYLPTSKRNSATKLKSSKTPKSLHRFHLYHKQTHPLPLLHQEESQPHFNLHLNTVSFTKEFSQPAKLHSIFILIYVTPTHTTHLIIQTYGTTMTLYLWFMTKTWVGLLCLLHGFQPSTNYISPTFQHTDLLTTLTVNKPSWTPTLLGQLKKRFSTIITNHDNSRLLDSTPKDKLLLP